MTNYNQYPKHNHQNPTSQIQTSHPTPPTPTTANPNQHKHPKSTIKKLLAYHIDLSLPIPSPPSPSTTTPPSPSPPRSSPMSYPFIPPSSRYDTSTSWNAASRDAFTRCFARDLTSRVEGFVGRSSVVEGPAVAIRGREVSGRG